MDSIKVKARFLADGRMDVLTRALQVLCQQDTPSEIDLNDDNAYIELRLLVEPKPNEELNTASEPLWVWFQKKLNDPLVKKTWAPRDGSFAGIEAFLCPNGDLELQVAGNLMFSISRRQMCILSQFWESNTQGT